MVDTAGSDVSQMSDPLAGLFVVEAASFVAGPSAGMSLAQMGAEVVRGDPPTGGSDAARWPLAPGGASLFWANLNKGEAVGDDRLPDPRGP